MQYIFSSLTCFYSNWDVGVVIDSALKSINEKINILNYYTYYPNNVASLLLFKYLFKLINVFISLKTIDMAFYVATIFNIITVDIAALFTLLTIKNILGKKCMYLSLIFIFPLMMFSPYILIPYTDTMTMLFPIIILYLSTITEKLENNSKKKYLLFFVKGFISALGITLKPTVSIILIAIFIIIISREISNIKTDFVKKSKYFLISIIIFLIGVGLFYTTFNIVKKIEFGNIISEKGIKENSLSFTHYLMMGMQEQKVGATNKIAYGSYSEEDFNNSISIRGYKERQDYNIKVVKERLSNFGFWGYIRFLYNKVNWVLCDGTFFYGQEGEGDGTYINKSNIARSIQKFANVKTNEYNVTAYIMQIIWILIIIGLIFAINQDKNKFISIAKLSIIGIIIFTLIFEGRSRYFVNYIPIFILVGTYGIKKCLKMIKK